MRAFARAADPFQKATFICRAEVSTVSNRSLAFPIQFIHHSSSKPKPLAGRSYSTNISKNFSVPVREKAKSSGNGVASILPLIKRRSSFPTQTMSTYRESSSSTCRLSRPLPAGTIDTHMHIIPPDFEKFPILSSAQYKPTPHTISDATSFYTQTSGLGIASPRMVLTQVSIYGRDNSALLSGLADLGSNGRGVVECDPESVSVSQLESWWNQGVRGIRINLVSVGRSVTEEELQPMLQAYVNKLSRMKLAGNQKWVIEMYISLPSVPMLLTVLPKLQNANNIRFCLDHFGGLMFKNDTANFGPDDDPHLIPGFSALLTLLTDTSLPEVYVKISAAYRIDKDYPSANALRRLGVVGAELVQKAEDRVMWASDWPHTRFEKVDSVPFVEACYEWCGEGEPGEKRRNKLFRENAELLWGMGKVE